jgi:Domain of unknown function (DUF4406)
MKRVYVAGPYTQGDPILNVRNAIKVADELLDMGYAPFIPHLTMLWHIVSPKSVHTWYDIDMAWLVVCDCVLRLQGPSEGADQEVELAKREGIPVFYKIRDIQV